MQVSQKLILQDSSGDNLIEEKESEKPESQVIIYGFLQKKSKYIHLWKTRFFILTKNYLFAFTGIENDADCTMALKLSTINEIAPVESQKQTKKAFVIRCEAINYFLRAENSIADKWFNELTKILDKNKNK